jgi:hypothetical protein
MRLQCLDSGKDGYRDTVDGQCRPDSGSAVMPRGREPYWRSYVKDAPPRWFRVDTGRITVANEKCVTQIQARVDLSS